MTLMLQTTPQTDPAARARRPDTAGPLAVATPTTRRLADASLSVNTRRAYAGALRRLDAWRGAAPVDDASLAVYLGALFEAGRAPATAALAVAAVRFLAKLAGHSSRIPCAGRTRSRCRPAHAHEPSRAVIVLVAARTQIGFLINSEWRKHHGLLRLWRSPPALYDQLGKQPKESRVQAEQAQAQHEVDMFDRPGRAAASQPINSKRKTSVAVPTKVLASGRKTLSGLTETINIRICGMVLKG